MPAGYLKYVNEQYWILKWISHVCFKFIECKVTFWFLSLFIHFSYFHLSTTIVGNAPEGFVLEQVHVVLQPGITSSKNDYNCVSVPNSSHQLANHTNQFLKHTSLHKSFRNIPNANSSVHCLKEGLHPLAHLQLHELGKLYKKFYIEKWNLESSHVAPKHFRLHSLDKGDSLSSLVSFMHGILPHSHFQNMIIHKADVTMRKSNSNNLNLECNFKHNLTDHLSKHFGKLSGDFHGLKNFSSIFLPNICTSLSQNSRNLTTEDTVQNSILQIDKGMKLCSSQKDCQYLADLHTYSWFKLFVKRVKMTSSKFEKVFISAVDRTFLSYLMSSFRYRNVKATHPGSHITIEIYRNQYEKVNPHYLKILYSGIDISHQIPLCTKFPSWSLCKLKYFVDFQKLKYKSLFESSPNIQKKCRLSVLWYEKKYVIWSVVFQFTTFVVGSILWGIILYFAGSVVLLLLGQFFEALHS